MTTDADKIDNLLAQRRELMDKIEEQIDERGRIIERIQSAPDTPIDRLRAQHRHCSCWGENCGVKRYPKEDWNSHCEKCAVTWPCDTIAALDALEAGLHELLDARPTRGQLFQRLDAATELIRQAMATVHILHFVRQPDSWHDLAKPDIDACPDCAPFRAWLAGDEEAGNGTD